MNNRAFDGFDDVIHTNMGIYGTDTAGLAHALADHDRREVKPTPEGLQISFTHDPCGTSTVAVIEWPDLVSLAHGIPPLVAYATRLNPQQPSLIERYPAFGSALGQWTQRGPGGPWMLHGNRCRYHACPRRELVILVDPTEVDESVRLASSQRWIRDEQALSNWARAAAAAHAQSQARR